MGPLEEAAGTEGGDWGPYIGCEEGLGNAGHAPMSPGKGRRDGRMGLAKAGFWGP